MNDREKLPELIDRFNNGKLTGEKLTDFLEMLKTNPRLREEVRLDSELNEILANMDILELRQKILSIQQNRQKRKGTDFYFFLLAASLLLLIGIEVLLIMNKTHRNPYNNTTLTPKYQSDSKQLPVNNKVKQAAITTKTVNKEKKIRDWKTEKRLAASFRKNPSFENMIGSTRHAGYFRMDAPLIGYRFSEKAEIMFEWTQDGHAEIELKIMDNTGTSIHESRLLDKNKYSLPPGTLNRGLYYFKVLQNDEIIFFGKFMVE
jgi:hypothetical protein